MVSIEPQRTHMSFDGLGDVFGALDAEVVAREVEGRQRPDGEKYIRIYFSGYYRTHLHLEMASAMAFGASGVAVNLPMPLPSDAYI